MANERCGPRTWIVRTPAAAFPWEGTPTNPFFDGVTADGTRVRTSGRGTRIPETSYTCDELLLHHTPDLRAADSRVVIYFHGHESALRTDVLEGVRVVEQIECSGMPTVLLAPQLALDAPDSHPGRLGEPGALSNLLDAAAHALTEVEATRAAQVCLHAPIILMGFSGGYRALASGLDCGGLDERIAGVVLVDGLYGARETYAKWAKRSAGFLVHLGGNSTAREVARLREDLTRHGVDWSPNFPTTAPVGIHLVDCNSQHLDMPAQGPPEHPFGALLTALGRCPEPLSEK